MFQINVEYKRPKLLEFVGSNVSQTGIIYGYKEPDCIILTSGGKHAESYGYEDRRNEDGSWYYIGRGDGGDQDPNKRPNWYLTNREKTVLLFSAREPTANERKANNSRSKYYKFEGFFEVISWTIIIPYEGPRKGDKLVQYHLIPLENIYNVQYDTEALLLVREKLNLRDFKKKIQARSKRVSKDSHLTIVEYRARSLEVKLYALDRANGKCENCNKPGPFLDTNGIPFLEVHHINSLCDDGPDELDNVVAVCPNCHREAHFGKRRVAIKEYLIRTIGEKESKI